MPDTEQQQLLRKRMLAAKRAASRRSTVTVMVVVGVLLLLPALVVGGLFVVGIAFGNRALNWMKEAQDPKRNGMPAIQSEIRSKQALGCQRVVVSPQIHFGGHGTLQLDLQANGPCVHLLGATTGESARLLLEQSSHQPLGTKLPESAPNFDYRLCPNVGGKYEFSVRNSANQPFTIAVIGCPRTLVEGLVRSSSGNPLTNGLTELRAWADEFRARGCNTQVEPVAWKGTQVVDVESVKGGPCFNLLALSHFADAPLTVALSAPNGRTMAQPTPATRVHIEYCPSETGRHQVEIRPSTEDHYAVTSFDCMLGLQRGSSKSTLPRGQALPASSAHAW